MRLAEEAGTPAPLPMPLWTLRLVASAGVVALLGRLPSSLPEALLMALGVCLLAFGVLLIADVAPRLFRSRRGARQTNRSASPALPHLA